MSTKKVFISYKREDRVYVAALAAALKSNGYEVWWDFKIVGGDQFDNEIKQALSDAFAVIVMITPEGEESKWMKREQFHAEECKILVIPLLR